MATYTYPLSGQETSEAEYEALMSVLVGSGVLAQPGSTYLKADSDDSSRIVYINEGSAILNGHFYQQLGYESVTIDVGSSQPRYDYVVLRLDASINTLSLHVIKGTPGSSPSIPGITQSNTSPADLPLAVVYVPANATTISNSNITDKRVWFKRRIANNTNAVKTAPAVPGDLAINTDTGQLEWYNNDFWQQLTPQIDASRVISGVLDPARLPLQNISNLIDVPEGLGTYGNWSPMWNKTTETWDWYPNIASGGTYLAPYALTYHSTPAVYPSFTLASTLSSVWGSGVPNIVGQTAKLDAKFYFIIRQPQPASGILPFGYYIKMEILQGGVVKTSATRLVPTYPYGSGYVDVQTMFAISADNLDTSVRDVTIKFYIAKSDSGGDGTTRLAMIDGNYITTLNKMSI